MYTTAQMFRYFLLLYISGEINIGILEDWYVPKLETLINNPKTADMVAQLELGLAELQDGLQTEDDFKNHIKEMLKE